MGTVRPATGSSLVAAVSSGLQELERHWSIIPNRKEGAVKYYAFGVALWAASLASGSTTCAAKTSDKASFETGVAPTPKNFPNHRPEDVEEMFQEARELGKFAIFIYQWSQPDLVEVAKQMMERSRGAGWTPA